MSTEENKAVTRRYFDEVMSKGNYEVLGQLIAGSYVYHEPGSGEVRGPEGVKALVSTYRSAFPDMQMTIEELIAEGDMIVARWTATGTHRGELMGIPPTGKHLTVSGTVIIRMADGKFEEEWENFDALGMLRQLGVIPS